MWREIFPSGRGPRWLVELLKYLRLAWRLLRDPLVPAWPKLIPLAALSYVLFPMDFVPDLIPGLGQVDDLTVILLAIKFFVDACPPHLVEKHLAQMSSVEASYRVVDDERPAAGNKPGYLDVVEPRALPQEQPSALSEEVSREADQSA